MIKESEMSDPNGNDSKNKKQADPGNSEKL